MVVKGMAKTTVEILATALIPYYIYICVCVYTLINMHIYTYTHFICEIFCVLLSYATDCLYIYVQQLDVPSVQISAASLATAWLSSTPGITLIKC